MDQHQILTVVITGGPCGGKTTMLAHLQEKLPEYGVKVIVVPEAARLLLGSGVHPDQVGPEFFQERIMRMQMHLEETALASARKLPDDRVIVLCDRGVMDSKAYIGAPAFIRIMRTLKKSETQLRDARYDAVIHLVTAADGAEEHYTCDAERFETPELARERDTETRNAWMGSLHLSIVDNATDFEGKKRRVLEHVLGRLGLPLPLEIERKFLVDRSVFTQLPQHACRIKIEQYYLPEREDPKHPGQKIQRRIRKRGQNSSSVYIYTEKLPLREGVRMEVERRISHADYRLLAQEATRVLRKYRTCFVEGNLRFELDDFQVVDSKLCVLEVEMLHENEAFTLPSWAQNAQEVTGDPAYSNFALAQPIS